MIETAILGAIGIVTVAAAVGVVTTRNVVYAAVFLLLSLVGVAALFLMMLAEFIALAQVLIYGGAITIVLLFGIMLTRAPEQTNVRDNTQAPLAAMACIGLFMLLVMSAVSTPWRMREPGTDPMAEFTALSELLFSDFLIPFEIASLVLLVALVGAVVLTRSGRDGS